VILTYNRRTMLASSLAGVLAQTHDDLEVLVVDNGSTDDTGPFLASITDPRLRVITMPANVNPTHARNIALDAARGEWVGFCDDDDLWAPDKVASMLAAAQAAEAEWVYCGCVYLDSAGEVVAGRPPSPPAQIVEALPVTYSIPGGLSGMMWRRDALDAGGRLDESLTYTDDWDVALRLLLAGAPAVAPGPLVAFRQHSGSWSRQSDEQRDEYDVIARKHARTRQRPIIAWRHHRYVAAEAARAGDRIEAIGHYLRAIVRADLGSIPRLFAVLLPSRAQRWVRRRLMSDSAWVDQGRAWVSRIQPLGHR
jgi:glycosyltransferase involved in cell wall biosynthesis